jgi:hypothetical protein
MWEQHASVECTYTGPHIDARSISSQWIRFVALFTRSAAGIKSNHRTATCSTVCAGQPSAVRGRSLNAFIIGMKMYVIDCPTDVNVGSLPSEYPEAFMAHVAGESNNCEILDFLFQFGHMTMNLKFK